MTSQASPVTPEQIEIRELKNILAFFEEHNEILKSCRSLDVGLTEQLSIIEKFRQSFSVTTLCHLFSVHRSSYKYWRCRSKRVSPELVKLKSLIKKVDTASNGSAGARSIADMARAQSEKLTRYRTSKIMKLLLPNTKI